MAPGPRIDYVGFGASVPDAVLDNRMLEQMVDTSDEWIQRRTGIRTRRILAEDETILDLAVNASRSALDDAGVTPEEIGDIQVGVNTWLQFPSLATALQKELGAVNASASDIAAGCAGFVYGVEAAHDKIFVQRVKYDRPLISLVVGVEGLSHITDWTDRNTCVLLGDGAGAAVLREVQQGGILATHTSAEGQYGHLLYSSPVIANQHASAGAGFTHEERTARPYLRMDGPRVYSRAIATMVREIHSVIQRFNAVRGSEPEISASDIDYIYPHQANLRIIEQVAEKLGVPLDRVYTRGVVEYGNTSTASIPLGRCSHNGVAAQSSGDRLEIDVAFGAGFASGAVLRQVCGS